MAIELIVRGACCLRPGVADLSPTIRVRSILGRFLEHSRIYSFANGEGEGRELFLMGSADLMERNLDRRVEVLVPILSPESRRRVRNILTACLQDDRAVWFLGADGGWTAMGKPDGISAQDRL